MTLLVRARELIGRPVVTLGGTDVAEVKDVLYRVSIGRMIGFSLNARGFLGGPLGTGLRWSEVHGLGRDAVMVSGEEAFRPLSELLDGTDPGDRDVLGDRVFTDRGVELGVVTDVVFAVESQAKVVGYEIGDLKVRGPSPGRKAFIPAPDTVSVSGEALVVPNAATDYLRDDLAGLGAAVEEFRARLRDNS